MVGIPVQINLEKILRFRVESLGEANLLYIEGQERPIFAGPRDWTVRELFDQYTFSASTIKGVEDREKSYLLFRYAGGYKYQQGASEILDVSPTEIELRMVRPRGRLFIQ